MNDVKLTVGQYNLYFARLRVAGYQPNVCARLLSIFVRFSRNVAEVEAQVGHYEDPTAAQIETFNQTNGWNDPLSPNHTREAVCSGNEQP